MADLFVLLGHPVGHSLSPAMHAAAFRAAHVPARYLALDARDFRAAWTAVRRLEVQGGNVTVPWKGAAADALDEPSEVAARIGSANTFWRTGEGRLAGTDTDGEGFLRALREVWGLDAAGARVTVLGAGGAARAVLHALGRSGAAALTVWNRTPTRAARLVEELRREGYACRVELADPSEPSLTLGADRAAAGSTDLLVNATAAGLLGKLAPQMDPAAFPGLRFAFDVVYAPRPTPFLLACARAGVPACDGRGMLLHQGALAFELWLGRAAPLEAMRDALDHALGPSRTTG
ncbi:MAG: shikimate dehydrogenase [Gemmatimonadota bacterium]